MRPGKPFTGSRSVEAQFLKSLTPEQVKIYHEAEAEKRETYQRFLKAVKP